MTVTGHGSCKPLSRARVSSARCLVHRVRPNDDVPEAAEGAAFWEDVCEAPTWGEVEALLSDEAKGRETVDAGALCVPEADETAFWEEVCAEFCCNSTFLLFLSATLAARDCIASSLDLSMID